MKIKFAAERNFSKYGLVILKKAMRSVTPELVEFEQVDSGGPGVLGFGVESEWTTLSPEAVSFVPAAERVLARAFRQALGMPPEPRKEPHKGRVLYFDIETHSADERWNLPPEEFFRLGQYAWGANGEVVLTTDIEEMRQVIREADMVVGHNIHSFDLSVLFGKDSTEPLEMARDGKVFDTFVYAITAFPAPDRYINRDSKVMSVKGPGEIKKWLSLDNLAFQFDVTGKIGDLKAMAKEHGGFCHIPLEGEFLEYAVQDVVALQELTHELISYKAIEPYDWREQQFAAICAQISRNGFKVDIAKATARRDELAQRKQVLMDQLVRDYNFPTAGKMPWRSSAGKAAIFQILADNGITPQSHPDWTLTATGNLSLGGDALKELAKGTDVEDLVDSLAELMGQRSLAQLALDSVQADGKAHPEISFLQRSGRTSVQRPGLTVWSSNGRKSVEKSYFIPDSDDELLVSMDYSNADARIVAAYSGDTVYLERMREGFDGHEMSGRFLFGDKAYDANPAVLRQQAKPAAHTWAYSGGAGVISGSTKVSLDKAKNFVDSMNARYVGVVNWQRRVIRQGESGRVKNDWGRVMPIAQGKSFTQSPAMFGQSGTRELVVDALIKMLHSNITLLTWIKVPVHDEIVYSIPKVDLEWGVPACVRLMETEWQPSDGSGQLIQFPVAAGTPATDWEKAGH